MASSPSPHFARPPVLAAVVTAVVVAGLVLLAHGRLSVSLGDTDDAMRLAIVRGLLGGETSWFHPHLARVQPPLGLDMHWSRLVDGGVAALIGLFHLVLSPAQAELAARLTWPLVWIFPTVWAALALARRLGGQAALLPAALLLGLNLLLYVQFWPGRIDHHNIQIAMAVVAIAGACAGGRGGGLVAGLATAFGLAVGLEALPWLALAGAGLAARFLLAPDEAPAARAYALTLLGAVSVLYLIQTPPLRLGVSACDALGLNLWAALVIAALGLLAVIALTRHRPLAQRLGGLAAVGAAAAGVYLALDPACLRGPLGGADARLKAIWLDQVTEMAPLLAHFARDRSDLAVCTLVLMLLGAAAWLWLTPNAIRTALRSRAVPRPTPADLAWLILGLALLFGAATALSAQRMASYANWFAVPLIAAALGDLARRPLPRAQLLALALTVAISQPVTLMVLAALPGWSDPGPAARAAVASRCVQPAAFARLAALPPGLVLGDVDLGPYVLAQTRHSVVSAPYHRMPGGILAAHDALAAGPGADRSAVERLRAAYILTCPARANQLNHKGLGPRSLQARLDRGEPPAWLRRLSPPGDPLQIYGVK